MKSFLTTLPEWLETNGLGGFAMGTANGIRTRRYHGLLTHALRPPIDRIMLVNGFEAWCETQTQSWWLTSQHYHPGVTEPQGHEFISCYQACPWPQWTYQFPTELKVEHELFMPKDHAAVVLRWSMPEKREKVTLRIRPLLSARSFHHLHRENSALRTEAEVHGQHVIWSPYPSLPRIHSVANAVYQHSPIWYRNFRYALEEERGLEGIEDLFSPGILSYELNKEDAIWILCAESAEEEAWLPGGFPKTWFAKLRRDELQIRSSHSSELDQASDHYIVRREGGKSVIAGYPWFEDWGRDTFISLRGLCLASGRINNAIEIFEAWSRHLSKGMIPNRFPDGSTAAEYNSVDASLWYVISLSECLNLCEEEELPLSDDQLRRFTQSILEVVYHYSQGTRYGIHMDSDHLLAAGEPGVALTWMDTKVHNQAVTPRIGKPVEIQALWINALWIASEYQTSPWKEYYQSASKNFKTKFWNKEQHGLYDVIDVDHKSGRKDSSIRPNQLFAIGGLPIQILEGEKAKQVVRIAEQKLWTPRGIRTLDPDDSRYISIYHGNSDERNEAYHQGTAWPWLLGPFVEAWVRIHHNSAAAKEEARRRFLAPLLQDTVETQGHLPEIADGAPPHSYKGCPFQAWSLAELLRLDRQVLSS